VLVILYDDTGQAAWSPYGGGIEMPTLDRLAKNGLTYTCRLRGKDSQLSSDHEGLELHGASLSPARRDSLWHVDFSRGEGGELLAHHCSGAYVLW
jgi:hypothetical protein